MSAAPTLARARTRNSMSEPPEGTSVRVEDIERALVLAREVAAMTAKGGSANMRIEHLQALFANGHRRVSAERMQGALEAAGLKADPPVTDRPESVELRIDKRRATLSRGNGGGGAAEQGDAERASAAEQAEQNTAQSIAALMPALILPVLAASFLGPLFGAAFAGLALLASGLLSRPGALADGKLGPIRMPASLARSFLLLSAGVALGALLTSLALVAAGGGDTKTSDPNRPLKDTTTAPQQTTPPVPPSAQQQQQQQREQQQADQRAAERRRAERRREARAKARARERRRERAAQRESTPPSGAAPDTGTTTTP